MVSLTVFVVVTIATLLAQLLGWFSFDPRYASLLVKLLVAELGLALAALVYSSLKLIGLWRLGVVRKSIITLHFDELRNPEVLEGQLAELVLYDDEKNVVSEQQCRIFVDTGARIAVKNHAKADTLFVGVMFQGNYYSGSFAINAYLIDLAKNQR